jgi:peptide/nickel transport system permease protein
MPVSEQTLERTREEMGLNRPMIVQYTDWLWGLLRLDMGTSLRLRRPVAQLLLGALPNTLYLTLGSILLVTLISLPVGVMCARREGALFDIIVQGITYILASFPVFFFALIMVYLLAFRQRIFPVLGTDGPAGVLMPVLVMSITLSGWYVRQVRAIILHEMQSDYVLGLRSRGIPENDIFRKHILRNARLPIITIIGLSFGSLLGGSLIVESIFSWPGIGRMEIEAIGYRDYPLIQGYIVWTTLIYLFINFIVEMLYGLLDPRVKRGKR